MAMKVTLKFEYEEANRAYLFCGSTVQDCMLYVIDDIADLGNTELVIEQFTELSDRDVITDMLEELNTDNVATVVRVLGEGHNLKLKEPTLYDFQEQPWPKYSGSGDVNSMVDYILEQCGEDSDKCCYVQHLIYTEVNAEFLLMV